MRTFGLLILLSGLGLTGCSDDGSPGSGGSGGSTGSTTSTSENPPEGSLETDYCAPLAAFVCGRLIACNCEVILPSGSLEQAACEADYKARCLEAYAPLAQAVEQGQAHVLAAEAAACIKLLQDSTPGCERPRGSVAQALCPAWYSGNGAVGEACNFPFCGEGAGVCIDGTCEAKPTAGLPCAMGGICAPGLLCLDGECSAPAAEGQGCLVDDGCTPPLRCVDGTCHPLVEKGGNCSQVEACALGLVCNGGICSDKVPTTCGETDPCGNLTSCFAPRVCAPKGKVGETCVEDASCEDGLRCEGSMCTQNPGLGEPCVNSVLCAAGLACTTDNGTCINLPGDGEACAFGTMGPFICKDPFGCVNGICGALPGEGEACTGDSRCADGFGCDFTAEGSFCVPLKDAGGSCQTDRTCKAGLYCEFSKNECTPILPAGSPCNDGNECGPEGSCLPGSGGAFECAPIPKQGERCLFDCASGLTCAPDVANSGCFAEVCLEL